MLEDLVTGLGVTLAYAAEGVALMALGYLLVDMTTPGRLHELVWGQRNRNAALLLGSNLIGVATIVVVAIVASEDDFVRGIVGAGLYGVLGLLVMTGAFLLLDLVTPGRLGEILTDAEPHPATWVSAVVHLAAGAIVAAAIL
jgi:uncharacterized membrane protein YjfL (UPF0719 family)